MSDDEELDDYEYRITKAYVITTQTVKSLCLKSIEGAVRFRLNEKGVPAHSILALCEALKKSDLIYLELEFVTSIQLPYFTETIANMKKLRALRIDGSSISANDVAQALTSDSLRKLTLANCVIRLEPLQRLPHMPLLDTLVLSQIDLSVMGKEERRGGIPLAAGASSVGALLDSCYSLRRLVLTNSKMTDEVCEVLARMLLREDCLLQQLEISGISISTKSRGALESAAKNSRSLCELRIDNKAVFETLRSMDVQVPPSLYKMRMWQAGDVVWCYDRDWWPAKVMRKVSGGERYEVELFDAEHTIEFAADELISFEDGATLFRRLRIPDMLRARGWRRAFDEAEAEVGRRKSPSHVNDHIPPTSPGGSHVNDPLLSNDPLPPTGPQGALADLPPSCHEDLPPHPLESNHYTVEPLNPLSDTVDRLPTHPSDPEHDPTSPTSHPHDLISYPSDPQSALHSIDTSTVSPPPTCTHTTQSSKVPVLCIIPEHVHFTYPPSPDNSSMSPCPLPQSSELDPHPPSFYFSSPLTQDMALRKKVVSNNNITEVSVVSDHFSKAPSATENKGPSSITVYVNRKMIRKATTVCLERSGGSAGSEKGDGVSQEDMAETNIEKEISSLLDTQLVALMQPGAKVDGGLEKSGDRMEGGGSGSAGPVTGSDGGGGGGGGVDPGAGVMMTDKKKSGMPGPNQLRNNDRGKVGLAVRTKRGRFGLLVTNKTGGAEGSNRSVVKRMRKATLQSLVETGKAQKQEGMEDSSSRGGVQGGLVENADEMKKESEGSLEEGGTKQEGRQIDIVVVEGRPGQKKEKEEDVIYPTSAEDAPPGGELSMGQERLVLNLKLELLDAEAPENRVGKHAIQEALGQVHTTQLALKHHGDVQGTAPMGPEQSHTQEDPGLLHIQAPKESGVGHVVAEDNVGQRLSGALKESGGVMQDAAAEDSASGIQQGGSVQMFTAVLKKESGVLQVPAEEHSVAHLFTQPQPPDVSGAGQTATDGDSARQMFTHASNSKSVLSVGDVAGAAAEEWLGQTILPVPKESVSVAEQAIKDRWGQISTQVPKERRMGQQGHVTLRQMVLTDVVMAVGGANAMDGLVVKAKNATSGVQGDAKVVQGDVVVKAETVMQADTVTRATKPKTKAVRKSAGVIGEKKKVPAKRKETKDVQKRKGTAATTSAGDALPKAKKRGRKVKEAEVVPSHSGAAAEGSANVGKSDLTAEKHAGDVEVEKANKSPAMKSDECVIEKTTKVPAKKRRKVEAGRVLAVKSKFVPIASGAEGGETGGKKETSSVGENVAKRRRKTVVRDTASVGATDVCEGGETRGIAGEREVIAGMPLAMSRDGQVKTDGETRMVGDDVNERMAHAVPTGRENGDVVGVHGEGSLRISVDGNLGESNGLSAVIESSGKVDDNNSIVAAEGTVRPGQDQRKELGTEKVYDVTIGLQEGLNNRDDHPPRARRRKGVTTADGGGGVGGGKGAKVSRKKGLQDIEKTGMEQRTSSLLYTGAEDEEEFVPEKSGVIMFGRGGLDGNGERVEKSRTPRTVRRNRPMEMEVDDGDVVQEEISVGFLYGNNERGSEDLQMSRAQNGRKGEVERRRKGQIEMKNGRQQEKEVEGSAAQEGRVDRPERNRRRRRKGAEETEDDEDDVISNIGQDTGRERQQQNSGRSMTRQQRRRMAEQVGMMESSHAEEQSGASSRTRADLSIIAKEGLGPYWVISSPFRQHSQSALVPPKEPPTETTDNEPHVHKFPTLPSTVLREMPLRKLVPPREKAPSETSSSLGSSHLELPSFATSPTPPDPSLSVRSGSPSMVPLHSSGDEQSDEQHSSSERLPLMKTLRRSSNLESLLEVRRAVTMEEMSFHMLRLKGLPYAQKRMILAYLSLGIEIALASAKSPPTPLANTVLKSIQDPLPSSYTNPSSLSASSSQEVSPTISSTTSSANDCMPTTVAPPAFSTSSSSSSSSSDYNADTGKSEGLDLLWHAISDGF